VAGVFASSGNRADNRMKLISLQRCVVLLSAAVITACTTSPAQHDYDKRVNEQLSYLIDWEQLAQVEAVTSLNQLIDSPDLHNLIAEAFNNNPGLQQTLLTLSIRQAEQRQSKAALLPEASATFDANKQQDSRSYTGAVSISWQLDLWHKLANSADAAAADTAQQQALYQAARDTLASEVIKTWLTIIAQQQALDIEQRRLASLQQNEQFILQRYRLGLGNLEDLDSTRSSVASTQATVADSEEQLAQYRRTLNKLLGRLDQQALPSTPASYPLVQASVAELPLQTLQRRPDLQAAYLAIQASSLRTQVAYKDLLPSINLSATLQDIANNPVNALLTDPVWLLLGQLSTPLYQGGKLKAAVAQAELNSEQSYQAFRDTLLTAVNEVQNALGQEIALAKQQDYLTQAWQRQQNNLDTYLRNYRNGTVTMLDLLSVQQQNYDLEAQLNTVNFNRLANRITLGLALGLEYINEAG